MEIVPISTSGDKMGTASLARVGGKGLFIRELEQALVEHRIDVAVHSMKDLPAIVPEPFRIAAVPRREAPGDVLLSRGGGWASLARGARLGTSSTRRRHEAMRIRPDLEILPLRGNVDSRLRRLQAGDFDGIIVAAAGLRRLGIADEGQRANLTAGVSMVGLDLRDFVPSGGQGALAVEALNEKHVAEDGVEDALAALTDLPTLAEVTAERAFLAAIGASCVSPVGVIGRADHDLLTLRALLFSVDGRRSLSQELADDLKVGATSYERLVQSATELGQKLARSMLEAGASELIGE